MAPLRAIFYPIAVAEPSSGVPAGGAASSPSAPHAAPRPSTAPSLPVIPAAYILVDWENSAHKCLEPLQHFTESVGPNKIKVVAFVGRANVSPPSPLPHVDITKTHTESKEAADTALIFCAGELHSHLAPSTRIIVVCGSDRRYEELEAHF